MDDDVVAAMEPFLTKQFYNPSAGYLAARKARQGLEEARAKAAILLGAKPSEIVFVAGATEGNNLAIQGIMKQFPDAEVLISDIEHESVLEPAEPFNSRRISVTQQGLIDLPRMKKMISPKTVLISVMLVNNELGTIQPLKDAAVIIKTELERRRQAGNRLPLYFHSDAAQAPSHLKLQVSRLGVDLMTINGSKIYGQKQTGALFVKAGVRLQPLIVGGGQERGLRSGTENIAGYVGLVKALELAQNSQPEESNRLAKLKNDFIKGLSYELPEAVINGSIKNCSPHILNVRFPEADGERLMMELDEKGIICATGSACSASDEKPSHVLKAIGLTDSQTRASLRFSFGRQTTEADIPETLAALSSLVGR
jgi:cysteine desulfurase